MRAYSFLSSLAVGSVVLGLTTTAFAQPAPGRTPGYGQPAPNYGGQPQPNYGGQPGYGAQPAQEHIVCCNASFRFNPVDLFEKRITLELEYTPSFQNYISVELDPFYQFGVGYSKSYDYSAHALGLYGKVGVWFEGKPLEGWNLKAVYRHTRWAFESDLEKLAFSENLLGVMFGSAMIFAPAKEGGFTLAWGIGVGYAIDARDHLFLVQSGNVNGKCDGDSRQVAGQPSVCITRENFALLGQFGLGYTF